jgi:hypothetical protein
VQEKKILSITHSSHKHFQQISGYQINIQKSIVFLYTNNEQAKKEIRKTIPLTIAAKKKKY